MVLWRAVACFLALGRRRVASKQRGARRQSTAAVLATQ